MKKIKKVITYPVITLFAIPVTMAIMFIGAVSCLVMTIKKIRIKSDFEYVRNFEYDSEY